MRRFLLPLLLVPLAAGPALAGKIKVWQAHALGDYDKATLSHAVVSSEGTIRLTRQLKPLVGLDAAHVWDVAEDAAGNLYAASGDEGKIFKVAPNGTVAVVYASDDSQVLCLKAAADGAVYAGTGPGGKVVRLGPDGKAAVFYRTGDSYVWSLALDEEGKCLYAGTGPKGRIHKITYDGRGDVFYRTRQDHVLSLARGPGLLYAGTDKDGLVYRIDAQGKGFVLFQAAQPEVRALTVADGVVYAGTSAPTRRRTGGGSGSSGESGVARIDGDSSDATPASAGGKKPVAATLASTLPSSSRDKDADKGSPAPSAPAPTSGENSVYRIAADGTAREVFRAKALVLSLFRQSGRLTVGTGMDGVLYEIDEASRERSSIARLDHGQIHCLLRRRDRSVVLGTGDPGKLYVLHDGYAAKGEVLSEVLDAKLLSRWGAIHWQGDGAATTRATVAVRSGNVAETDETWSDWSAEQADPKAATAGLAPPARYLQYRVTLSTDDPAATPAVRDLTVQYATVNQAPEVASLDAPDPDAAPLKEPKKLKFKWRATDPNEDELTYSFLVRRDGWKEWVTIEDGLAKPEYEWDTTTTPAGIYRVKVVASDRPDNPAAEALAAERMSGPVVVAHVPPTVAIRVARVEGSQAVLEADASDPLVRLTAAAYSLDGRKWVSVFPADGLFDGRSKAFRFTMEALTPGTHVVVLRVRDAAGNVGAGDAVFTVTEKKEN